jgi:hypothetical protein
MHAAALWLSQTRAACFASEKAIAGNTVSSPSNFRAGFSGGKVIGEGRMPTNNRATTVLRMAAKLARLVHRMLRYGMKYVDQEPSSMRPNTANSRSSISSEKPPS